MRSRSPLLASRAFKPTVAFLQVDVVKSRVAGRVNARDLQAMLSSKGAGSLRNWRKEAIAVPVGDL